MSNFILEWFKLIDLILRLQIYEEKSKKNLFNKLSSSENREIKQQHKTSKKVVIYVQENWLGRLFKRSLDNVYESHRLNRV